MQIEYLCFVERRRVSLLRFRQVKKYCGDYKTQLRIKLLTNNGVLFSEEFEGYINPRQFDLTVLLNKKHPRRYDFINKDLAEEYNRIKRLMKK